MPNGSFWLAILVEFWLKSCAKLMPKWWTFLLVLCWIFDQFCAEKLCKNDAGVVDVPVGHALNFDQFVAKSCAKMVLKWPKIFGEYRPCSIINSGLWEHKFYLLLGSESTVLSAALAVTVRESDRYLQTTSLRIWMEISQQTTTKSNWPTNETR